MPRGILNLVWFSTSTTGTGTVTVGPAFQPTGDVLYLTPDEAGAVNADTYEYTIFDGSNVEHGVGTYTSSGTTFSRDTVYRSKISGVAGTSKINLSGSANIIFTASARTYVQAIEHLTTETAPAAGDLIAVRDVSDSTTDSITIENLFKVVDLFTAEPSIDVIADEIAFFDASAAAARKLSPDELLWQGFLTSARRMFFFYTDFIQETSTTATDNGLFETISGTGAAATQSAVGGGVIVGQTTLASGTTATGRVALSSATSIMIFGGGDAYFEALVYIFNASTSVERFQLLVGFVDTLTAANQTDGAYLLYDEGGVSTGSAASANWQAVTASNSSRTFTTTGTAASIGSFMRIGIRVNAAGTSVDFLVNGTVVATHTTNIPNAASRNFGFGVVFLKSAGLSNRNVALDYVLCAQKFTTLR